jgi:hypothetical protein
MSSSTRGLSLQPHPAPWLYSVNRTCDDDVGMCVRLVVHSQITHGWEMIPSGAVVLMRPDADVPLEVRVF